MLGYFAVDLRPSFNFTDTLVHLVLVARGLIHWIGTHSIINTTSNNNQTIQNSCSMVLHIVIAYSPANVKVYFR